MNNLCRLTDTHDELWVQAWNGGIKLLKPNSSIENSSAVSVRNLMNLSANVYFTLRNSVIKKINDSTAKVCGFASASAAEGRTVADVAKKETYYFEYNHDNEVINQRQLIIKEEVFKKKNDESVHAIAMKIPWYGDLNQVIGVFGCSICITHENSSSLAAVLVQALNTGFFGQGKSPHNNSQNTALGKAFKNVYLSPREMQCAELLIKGKTAKEISCLLDLSCRTVESYISNMKIKFSVNSKSQLIEKILFFKSKLD